VGCPAGLAGGNDRLDAVGDFTAEACVVAAVSVADVEVRIRVDRRRRVRFVAQWRKVTVEEVVTRTAVQRVVPERPDQEIVAVLTVEDVGPRATGQLVVSVPSTVAVLCDGPGPVVCDLSYI